jgi:predicted unusual protein kinase regulating ubiquinone biosynthesis (AarF/ABC1/UbiB family)
MVNEGQNESALGRGWCLGKLGFRLAGSYLGHQLQEVFLRGEAREESRRRFRQESSRQFREELQSLRGPIMKMGQALSMQDHVLPPELIEELSKLQMQAPAMHPTLTRAQFRASFGKDPEDVFREFAPEPFAAASLGQVHRAITKQGEPVVVKIQYPAMQTAIKNDFKLVRSTNLTSHIPPSVIDEFERGILVETDYLNEARNIAFFRDALKPLDYVRVPRVYRNLTTDRVLTMSFVEGVPLSQLLTHKPTQQVRNHLGRNLLELFLFQIYHVRALHADPHPGNYLFNADGHIGLVDFGCVKMFSRDMAELIHCFLNRAWLQGDGHIDRMMRLLWPKVSPSNEKARAILLTEIDLFNMLYPPPGSRQRVVCFSNPEIFKSSFRRNIDVLLAKLAQPEFPFYERAESGLFNYLRQLEASLDTNNLLSSIIDRANLA